LTFVPALHTGNPSGVVIHGSDATIEVDGKSVLIDPFITNNPAAPVKVDELRKVDYVIVTHEHFDHLGDAFEICKKNDALFVALYELAVKAEQNGVKRTLGANMGGTFTADGLSLTFVPALHTGNPSGVVIHGSDATSVTQLGTSRSTGRAC
jgi:L-ascorbate metabolism protein UlaG (beta-lactamase superfamily)